MSSYIYLYTHFFTKSHIYIKGRLLKGRTTILKPQDGYLFSLYATFIRSFSREIRNHPIVIECLNQSFNITSDPEGYFELLIPNNWFQELTHNTSVSISIEIKKKKYSLDFTLTPYAHKMPMGIISDIDDTVMASFIKSFLKIRMLIQVIFINPFRRKPIAKAVQFYRHKLEQIPEGGPIIYVSNSPWNMYDYLKVFLDYNDFPQGEIQLRDFGWHLLKRKNKALEEQNKYLEIEKLLNIFKQTKFILIGDAAEKDFYIYTLLLENFPDRISQIIILKAGNKKNDQKIAALIKKKYPVPITLADSYEQLLPQKDILLS